MEEGKPAYRKEVRKIIIRTTEGETISGKVNIGIKDRVSDLFTKSGNQFIVLFDAEHKNSSGKVLFVNKDNIVWVEPEG
ncbi:MAG: hypothetical protein JRG75_06445 [Deltaproteobacteria bacterium]|jgi:small nuclear ribonucleoprotein (snRNP)-like protein|nr:hypothetical protein [Deltaproteobacteria bacterium]